ncbi:MAG: hypothetical protein IT436_11575 [Phycisphaerales bacterium]|nr:hypothetical protein [Phycisphaerales bacterium]
MRVLGIAVCAVIAASAYGQCTPEPLPVTNPFSGIRAIGSYQGQLLVGGSGQGVLKRWDGSAWRTLGAGPGGAVDDTIEYEGSLWACGTVTGRVRRWDGAAWYTMTTSMTAPSGGVSVAMFANFRGELIIGGKFITVDGRVVNNVARWDGATWQPLGAGCNNDVICLRVHDDVLYAGGYFTQAGGRAARYIAQWDGVEWSPVGDGFDGAVFALASYNGDLAAAGQMQHSGAEATSMVARFDGSAWRGIGGGLVHETIPYGAVAPALAEYRGQLLVGGTFTKAGGKPAKWAVRWTGTEWIELPGFTSFPWLFGIVNDEVYAGGSSVPLKRFACPPCPADLDEDGRVDFADYLLFINLYEAGDADADLNDDGFVDESDWLLFFEAYAAGC